MTRKLISSQKVLPVSALSADDLGLQVIHATSHALGDVLAEIRAHAATEVGPAFLKITYETTVEVDDE